jgi:hypothetical protein
MKGQEGDIGNQTKGKTSRTIANEKASLSWFDMMIGSPSGRVGAW